MDQHSIKNVKSPVDRLDAVNKAYADRIKYKTATFNIPNTVMTDHTLFTFPTAKAFASEKIKICDMCASDSIMYLFIFILTSKCARNEN